MPDAEFEDTPRSGGEYETFASRRASALQRFAAQQSLQARATQRPTEQSEYGNEPPQPRTLQQRQAAPNRASIQKQLAQRLAEQKAKEVVTTVAKRVAARWLIGALLASLPVLLGILLALCMVVIISALVGTPGAT